MTTITVPLDLPDRDKLREILQEAEQICLFGLLEEEAG